MHTEKEEHNTEPQEEEIITEMAPEDQNAETNDHADEVAELKDKYLRLMAEFENFKKRSVREKLASQALAARDTLRTLLPVLDDFDRAKQISDDENSEEHFTEGVTLVYEKLQTTLDKLGLKKMDTNGAPFHGDYHEAITELPAPSPDMAGHIIDTIEAGYTLNDTIIRHAKVVVGK